MTTAAPLQAATAKPTSLASPGLLLQRKCACGASNSSIGDKCEECQSKTLQRKLSIGSSSDPMELEADRVADQVMQSRGHDSVGAVRPKIQRFSGQPSGEMGAAPASVDRVLASSGRPLEPALRSDMEQRFGYDFSRVRVHSGADAELSAREVSARAYTVGSDVVFGAGSFAPGNREGRRLIAHELTHVVQQKGVHAPVTVRRIPFREKANAAIHIGLIPAHRAKKLADEALDAATKTGLPGLHNGPADAWRHCYWNCRMTQVIGKDDAEFVSENHEEHTDNNPANERMMDTWNNEQGRECAQPASLKSSAADGDYADQIQEMLDRPSVDCDACCQQRLDAGKLWVIYGDGKVGRSKPTPRGGSAKVKKYEPY